MKDKKKIVIGVLCALVGVMAVGYAALAQQLNITGTASIDSTWKVEITNISERDIVGDATSKEVPSYTATTANFSVGLIQPGDSITYDIEVSNLGTLAAKVDSIDVIMDENDAIIYKAEGIESGDKLGVDETNTLSVTVAYDPEVTSQPTNTAKDITVSINYVQDIDGSDVVDPKPDVPGVDESTGNYDYVIGDQITFAGSNWRVIKNSSAEEDYVTLLKESGLTSSELGEYRAYDQSGRVGMSYYYDATCHSNSTYEYTDYDASGCAGHNDYEGSKVREFLEGTYINTLGADNLKEVNGYKIRLVNEDELFGNLGYSVDNSSGGVGNSFNVTDNVPEWVPTDNFGSYWTMYAYTENASQTFYNGGNLTAAMVNQVYQIRPVINLLKTSI